MRKEMKEESNSLSFKEVVQSKRKKSFEPMVGLILKGVASICIYMHTYREREGRERKVFYMEYSRELF